MKKGILFLLAIGLMVGAANAKVNFDTSTQFTTLVTPSVTAEVAIIQGAKNLNFIYTVTGISTNVVLRPEGSIDGSVWVPIADDRTDTTITASDLSATNGYADRATNRAYRLGRVTWVSKSGAGTTPNVAIRLEVN